MYAQATVPQFHQRRYAQPFSRSPVSLQGFQKGFQRGIHTRNEKCDCIKYLKLGDPACGSGSLLLKSAKILGLKNVRQGFYGQEINITTYNLCRMNMFLHDVDYDKFDIACEDTLTAPQHWDDEPFEVIVSNAREVFGLTARNRINKGFPGHTPLFLCPEIRAVRHRMAA